MAIETRNNIWQVADLKRALADVPDNYSVMVETDDRIYPLDRIIIDDSDSSVTF